MITYKRISEAAGVSESTVSKALSGSAEISPKTAERIRSIACELGYYSDKRVLRREYSGALNPHVAIICPEIISIFYSSIAESLIHEIMWHGGRATVMISRFGSDEVKLIVDSVAGNPDFDGIISMQDFECKKNLNIPVVFLSHGKNAEDFDEVYCDANKDIETAVEYLLTLGHRIIGFGGEMHTVSKEEKFRECLKKHNCTVYEEYISRTEKRFYDAGRECFRKYKKNDMVFPDAIVFAYDEIALGFMAEAAKNGVKIPDDVSVVGINNTPFCSVSSPTLTSVANFRPELAKKAYELLVSRILGENFPPQNICCDNKLVERESVLHRKVK